MRRLLLGALIALNVVAPVSAQTVTSPGGASAQGIPSLYVGQVATRSFMPRNVLTGANLWQMTRSFHVARDNIVNPKLCNADWYVANNVEHAEGAGTIKQSIEFPAGTFTVANENSGGPTAFNGLTCLTYNISIPNGASFWVRTLIQSSNGIVFKNYQSNQTSGQALGEGWENGSGTATDKTTTGTVSPNVITYMPVLIVAPTRKPSFLIVGDSRQEGGAETITDATGDVGETVRAIGRVDAYASISESGQLLNGYLTNSHTLRDALYPFFSHVVDAYGINDLASGGWSAAQLAAGRSTFAALYPSKIVIGTTLAPYVTTSDGFFTTANEGLGTNQPKVRDFNVLERAGLAGESFTWDIADAIDPYRLNRYPVTRNPSDATRTGTQATFTSSISGTTLTVTAVSAGTINLNDPITDSLTGVAGGGSDVNSATTIAALGTGTGGTGTYTVNISQTVASRTMYTGAAATKDGLHMTAAMSEIVRDSGRINLGMAQR